MKLQYVFYPDVWLYKVGPYQLQVELVHPYK